MMLKRGFLLYSNKGRTSGNFKDLMKAGRLDIAVHSIIHAFFLSNALRSDVEFHLVLNGPPDPPKHIKIISNPNTPFSKKDIGTLLKITLFKFRKGKITEAFPGVYVEKKSFREVVEELKDNFSIYLLDKRGNKLDKVKIEKNPLFVVGDYLGIPRDEKKFVKKYCKEVISLGKVPYFTSQCIIILNFYLDSLTREVKAWRTTF